MFSASLRWGVLRPRAPHLVIIFQTVERSLNDQAGESREILRVGRRSELRAAPDQRGGEGGRVRYDHGPLRSREDHATQHSRHAGRSLERRILAVRQPGTRTQSQTPQRAAQTLHRICLPAIPPARRSHRLRKPRHPPLVSQRQAIGACGDRGRLPRPFSYCRQERSLPRPTLRRPAATGGGCARCDHESEAHTRRRTDR